MKTINTKPFKNKIALSGEIVAMDDMIRYIPIPLAGFDIHCYREQKNNEDPNFDHIRVITFDNETVLDDFEIGNRVLIKGELQSRNHTTTHPITDELIQNGVELYTSMFGDGLPAEIQPTSRIRQPLSWDMLLKHHLITEIPADSMIRENGVKEKNEIQCYVYRIDHNGEVYKEMEHTAFEVIAHEITKLEEPLNPLEGDVNHVVFHGRVSRPPIFDIIEGNPFAKVTLQSFVEYFQPDEKRFVFFNFFVWGKNAEILLSDLAEGDQVRFTGRIQSKEIERVLRLKKKNSAGKTKRKKIPIIEITREVSVGKMAKIIQKTS
ncbi:single-stranded DNA-binding protein [Bacillus toyonensis]|uniref:single-stranded DNA-binding protein n=1 Tax=Bacillus toyonensis TaxID=155322 RepID=UPI002E206843|nr:single-stranded DNA-binding protein [Bacillus toyonensis]MED2737498.1 single-stranded DNA-binding protein [Bacillus toyonensis]